MNKQARSFKDSCNLQLAGSLFAFATGTANIQAGRQADSQTDSLADGQAFTVERGSQSGTPTGGRRLSPDTFARHFGNNHQPLLPPLDRLHSRIWFVHMQCSLPF